MQAHDACIEFGHVYLNQLVEGVHVENLDAVRRTIDRFDNPVTMTIIDDTTNDSLIARTDSFERKRDALTEEYIEMLPITPDIVCYESDFTSCIERMLNLIPRVSNEDLTTDLSIGLYENRKGTYIYSSNGDELHRARVKDTESNASKVTGYTCGAYDAAITLAKLGVIDAPKAGMTGEVAITFHEERYLGSTPFERSRDIRAALNRAKLFITDTDNVINVSYQEEPELDEVIA